MHTKTSQKLPVVLTAAFLVTVFVGCLLYLLFFAHKDAAYIADIYQNGELLTSIPLSEAEEPYTFTVTGDNGCTNEIEVRPGSIGILSADCPDKLCVRQGFISDSLLPVTCLPNKVVIQLRPDTENPNDPDSIIIDIITY